MSFGSSLASSIDARRGEIIVEAVAALPKARVQTVSIGEETVAGCLSAITAAIRARNPHAIRRWLAYELHSPEASDLLVCLNAAINQITLELKPNSSQEITQALRFLDWIRSDALLHLSEFTPGKAKAVIGDHITGIVEGLVHMMRVQDEATAEHLLATGQLAERLAVALGMDEEMVAQCRLSAQLHDLGKVGVEEGLLRKGDPLSAHELDLLWTHSEKGERLLAGIPGLAHLAPIVRAHHEWMDGSGYPDQLTGEEIPLESRIIAVVDAFHTMTVPSAYHEILSVEAALKELSAFADTQFDEHVVEAFVEIFGYSYDQIRITA